MMSMFDEAPDYEQVRNPNLPWGYWLMHDNQGDERLVDELAARHAGKAQVVVIVVVQAARV